VLDGRHASTFELWQVHVFTTCPLSGKSAAVLFGENCRTPLCKAWRETPIFYDTVFILPSAELDADYRVRLFKTRWEIPFAGHPTLTVTLAVLSREIEQIVQLNQTITFSFRQKVRF